MRYNSITYGRAFASFGVLLFHLGNTISQEKYFGLPRLGKMFIYGDCGVFFFFVLSGFVIYKTHSRDISNPGRWLGFIIKRFVRIYPSYWLVFSFVWVFGGIISGENSWHSVNASSLVKEVLLIPREANTFAPAVVFSLVVAWTLRYEVFFYLLFSFFIVNTTISFGFVLFLVLIITAGSSDLAIISSFKIDYILLFVMGVFSGMFSGRLTISDKILRLILLFGICLFFVSANDTLLEYRVFDCLQPSIYGVASSLCILAATELEDRGQLSLRNALVLRIGESSYCLYLIHCPLISFVCKLAVKIGFLDLGVLGATISFVFAGAMSIAVSFLMHEYFENPMMSYLKTKSKS